MAQLENFRLKVFPAVAEHLNFRRAAEHLFFIQPAVTLQVKALENSSIRWQPRTTFEKMVASFTDPHFTPVPDYWNKSGELSLGEQMPAGMSHYEKYTGSERMNPGWQRRRPTTDQTIYLRRARAAENKDCSLHGATCI